MNELIATILERADIILFDTPPALAVTDASVLAKSADGVLLIAQVGATRLPAFYQALSELQRVGVRIIGAVLNKLPPRGSRYYSYYYYHYSHYYYYYPDGEESETSQRVGLWRRKRKKEKT